MVYMRKLLLLAILPILMLSIRPAPAFAGPWVQEKDKALLAFTVGYTFFDSYIDSSGNTVEFNDEIRQYKVLLFYNEGMGGNRDVTVLVGLAHSDARDPMAGVSSNRDSATWNVRGWIPVGRYTRSASTPSTLRPRAWTR